MATASSTLIGAESQQRINEIGTAMSRQQMPWKDAFVQLLEVQGVKGMILICAGGLLLSVLWPLQRILQGMVALKMCVAPRRISTGGKLLTLLLAVLLTGVSCLAALGATLWESVAPNGDGQVSPAVPPGASRPCPYRPRMAATPGGHRSCGALRTVAGNARSAGAGIPAIIRAQHCRCPQGRAPVAVSLRHVTAGPLHLPAFPEPQPVPGGCSMIRPRSCPPDFVLSAAPALAGRLRSQYGVSVDSCAVPRPTAPVPSMPRPGVEGMAEDDLLFRDVAAQLEPCFTARGYTLKLDEQTQDKSDNLVFISFGISEPDVRIYTTVSYVPYTWGRGTFFAIPAGCARKRRGPRSFPCRAAAGRLHAGTGRRPRQEPLADRDRCTGQDDDFRTLLQAMLPVLQQHLGKETSGRRYFVVTLDEDTPPVVEEKEVAN